LAYDTVFVLIFAGFKFKFWKNSESWPAQRKELVMSEPNFATAAFGRMPLWTSANLGRDFRDFRAALISG